MSNRDSGGIITRFRNWISAAGGARSISRDDAFDAANDSGLRTSVLMFPGDSELEITPFRRREVVRKSRFLRNNVGLAKWLAKGVTRYSLGRGLRQISATDDSEWNLRCDEALDEWAQSDFCDVRGNRSFGEMQRVLCNELQWDGEHFAVMLSGMFPQLQLVKQERIGEHPNYVAARSRGREGAMDPFEDGIRYNSLGRALAYRINTLDRLTGNLTSQIFPAKDVVHLFEAERSNQRRGLPWAYHGVNSMLDIMDQTSLEKQARKLHSVIAAAISGGGRNEIMGPTVRRKLASAESSSGSGRQGKSETTFNFEKVLQGAGIFTTNEGEFKLYTSQRETVELVAFLEFIIRDLSWGYGLSPEFVWNIANVGGANTRLVVQDAQNMFDDVQNLMVRRFCRRVRNWVVAKFIKSGRLPMPEVDPRWWLHDWQGPRKVTVDTGRDGALEIQQLKNGMMLLDEYWAMRGKVGRIQRRRRIDEIADDLDYCRNHKKGPVPPELYFDKIQSGAALSIDAPTGGNSNNDNGNNQ